MTRRSALLVFLVGTVDDWIPYTMFAWTDTDGDHVPEILDTTPYGTSGP
jgi:hypothetical protein